MALKWGILDTEESLAQKAAAAAGQKKVLVSVTLLSAVSVFFATFEFLYAGMLFAGLEPGLSPASETAGFPFPATLFPLAGPLATLFGALFFGSLADRRGRQRGLVFAVILMALASSGLALFPEPFATGQISPATLVLRCFQGLAFGGVYALAMVYVAETAAKERRGRSVAWVQFAAGLGLVVAMWMRPGGELADGSGWRLLLVASLSPLVLLVLLHKGVRETRAFQTLKTRSGVVDSPLTESFFSGLYPGLGMTVLLGLMVLQGVLFYAAYVYSHRYLSGIYGIPAGQVDSLLLIAAAGSLLLFPLFCFASDYLGRRTVVMTGTVLALAGLWPAFQLLGMAANPAHVHAADTRPVTIIADPATCLKVPVAVSGFQDVSSGCDVARLTLSQAGVDFRREDALPGGQAMIRIGDGVFFTASDLGGLAGEGREQALTAFAAETREMLQMAGYYPPAVSGEVGSYLLAGVLLLLMAAFAMVSGPATLMALESFPASIRCTTLAFPLHFAFLSAGALMPFISLHLAALTGRMYAGVWFAMGVIALALLVQLYRLEETSYWDLDDEA